MADELKQGNDQLYEVNHKEINSHYEKANEAL